MAAHPVEGAARGRAAVRPGERADDMQIEEGLDAVAGPRLNLLGDRGPARAGVHTLEEEAGEQRDRVHLVLRIVAVGLQT